MTERPILFSTSMVLALLAGTKTQTRRLVKGDVVDVDMPEWWGARRVVHQPRCQRTVCEQVDDYETACGGFDCAADGRTRRSPYGAPGDRLWVRETWGYRGAGWCNKAPDVKEVSVEYAADRAKRTIVRPSKDESGIPKQHVPKKFDGVRRASDCNTDEEFALSCEYGDWMTRWWRAWRPSIFLPRWASRLTLEVTDVRVERLQDISEKDALAEGTANMWLDTPKSMDELARWTKRVDPGSRQTTHRGAYAMLWESINSAGSWALNPWVWVVEFRRLP